MNLNRREFIASGLTLPLLGCSTSGPKQIQPVLPPEPIFPTGFPTLDEAIGGGLRPGNRMLIVGGSGSGKTSFVHRIAETNGVKKIRHGRNGNQDILAMHAKTEPYFEHDTTGYKSVVELKKYMLPLSRYNFATTVSFPIQQQPFDLLRFWHGHDFRFLDLIVWLHTDRQVSLFKNRHGRCFKRDFKIGFSMWEGCYEVLPNSVG